MSRHRQHAATAPLRSHSRIRESTRLRVDVLLVERGVCVSREVARRAIMAGEVVTVDGQVVDKPGTLVDRNVQLRDLPSRPFVGRGGFKLDKALREFDLCVAGKVAVDVGASTGGFTDCLLQRQASLVYSVDTGYGQLAWRLRTDPRVVVMERTNFRHVSPDRFRPQPSLAVMDVSFISIRLLLPRLLEVVTPDGDIVSLIKPQFEAGKPCVGKGGVVRDPQVHVDVLRTLLHFGRQQGLTCAGLQWSPIQGSDGNIEYLAWWRRGYAPIDDVSEAEGRLAGAVVESAWRSLRAVDVKLTR